MQADSQAVEEISRIKAVLMEKLDSRVDLPNWIEYVATQLDGLKSELGHYRRTSELVADILDRQGLLAEDRQVCTDRLVFLSQNHPSAQ